MPATTVAPHLYLAKRDKQLATVIKRVGPCPLKRARNINVYRALARSIVFQQLSGKAASTIYDRVCTIDPDAPFPRPERLLKAPVSKLRSLGLSGAKASYLLDLAAHEKRGDLPNSRTLNKLSDEEIILRLTSIKGVGPWSVQMFLMFTLGRLDVFPVTDFGVRKGYAILFNNDPEKLPKPKELLELGAHWAPYRSIASWYLWRVLEQPST